MLIEVQIDDDDGGGGGGDLLTDLLKALLGNGSVNTLATTNT
jgi:hypothetical protein